MPQIFQPIASEVTNAGRTLNDLLTQKITDTGNPTIPSVPPQYYDAVQSAVSHTGMPTSTIVAQINAENGGNWDPQLRGKANPNDVGITQLNSSPTGAIAEMTKTLPNGSNFFQQTWGHPFNIGSGNDQIKMQANYLNYLRQYLLPSMGMKNPTDAQVIAAYNNATNPGLQRSYLGLVNSKMASTAPQLATK